MFLHPWTEKVDACTCDALQARFNKCCNRHCNKRCSRHCNKRFNKHCNKRFNKRCSKRYTSVIPSSALRNGTLFELTENAKHGTI